jgi:hypothetical protein
MKFSEYLLNESLKTKEEIKKAIDSFDELPSGKQASKAREILKAAEDVGYIIKKSEILKYSPNLHGGEVTGNKSLNYSKSKSLPNNFEFPKKIDGMLDLSGLTSLPENIKFPEEITGSLDLSGLTSLPENIILPSKIGGYLNLGSLVKFPNKITMPKEIGMTLYVGKVKSIPDNVKKQLQKDLLIALDTNSGNEKIKVESKDQPSINTFKKLAKESKDLKDFLNKVREIKNVPYKVSVEFRKKYGKDDSDMETAAKVFFDEIKHSKN